MSARSTGWIRGPLWDVALLALPWVPLYLWFVFGLRIGDGGGEVHVLGERFDALALATLVVLAITFVHRHYTFVLVYGDAQAFGEHARAYVVAPVLLFAALAAARHAGDAAWGIALAASGTWNVWHTVQQRYGILRVYAAKAGGGLEGRAHARRDQRLVWSLVSGVALALVFFRRASFLGHESARRALFAVLPFVESPWFAALGALLGLGAALAAASWLRAELKASVALAARVPRLTFLASTVALLAVFVVHGPVVGYLTFGSAHALEYVAFVHHFGQRKFARREGARSLASALLRRPLLVGPLLSGGLALLYFALQPAADGDLYLTYYLGSSMLHFLYDGWIWKVHKPAVAEPLGARAAAS